MFGMLVHDCFVDDGNGKEKFRLIDENGCSLEPGIVGDLTYNTQSNMAYAEGLSIKFVPILVSILVPILVFLKQILSVNVFKFADKVSVYFQCALSTCMISEGMCKGKTPPRCGPASRRRRTIDNNQTSIKKWANNEMDLAADKIIVLDLEDLTPKQIDSPIMESTTEQQKLVLRQLNEIRSFKASDERLCFTREVITLSTCTLLAFTCSFVLVFLWRYWRKNKL
jgi:hypothetical protein